MNAKQTAFVAMMSALGLLLSAISLNVAPWLSSVGQGGAALDLSHIATFIAAIFGGPIVGAIVGFLSGIYAGYYFGYVLGTLGLLSVIGVPFGKALTGLTAGFLYKKLKIGNNPRSSTLTIPVVLGSYIPESLYTIAYFLYIVQYFYGYAMTFMIPIVIPKAWIEITIMSLLMGALAGNTGFKEFIFRFLYTQKMKKSEHLANGS
ncbi:ECF transporter S component [Candidatus Bathyarchaeota archaeon]|nr:ECF transporter S component [Candidatus Bathyarchaeota archaeon]